MSRGRVPLPGDALVVDESRGRNATGNETPPGEKARLARSGGSRGCDAPAHESRSLIGDHDRDVMIGRSGFALVAVVLTLLSGALMVLAGYLWHESGWSSATWSALGQAP
jgi:hypothetical protein